LQKYLVDACSPLFAGCLLILHWHFKYMEIQGKCVNGIVLVFSHSNW